MAPLNNLRFPFANTEKIFCTHSSGSGSHSWENAYFAIDLANAYDKPAAIIHASEGGRAFTFEGNNGKLCPEPKGTAAKAESSNCGNSWGNSIKILHADGYYTFYVHMDHFLIKNGELVKQGQPIGVEGWTGAAGHRHLHWSVQKLPGKNKDEWEKEITWDGKSIPFQFKATQNGMIKNFNTAKIQCAHANVGQAPPDLQPVLPAIQS